MKEKQSKLKYIDEDVLRSEFPELIFNVSYINEHFGDLSQFVEKYNIPGITNGKIFIHENTEENPINTKDIIITVLNPLGFKDKKDYFSTQFYNKTRAAQIEFRAGIKQLSYGFAWFTCLDDETGVYLRYCEPDLDLDEDDYISAVKNNNWGEHTFSNYLMAPLTSPDQLPDINCWQITIVVRQECIHGYNCFTLYHEGSLILKTQGGGWEYYDKFLEIAKILHKKYGKYLMDVVPDMYWMSLYGDSISGVFEVHNLRMKIREKHRLARKVSREDIYEVALQELVEEERKKNPDSFLNRWMSRLEEYSPNLDESAEKKINEMLKKIANDERQNKP